MDRIYLALGKAKARGLVKKQPVNGAITQLLFAVLTLCKYKPTSMT
jgi:hypothetical protein